MDHEFTIHQMLKRLTLADGLKMVLVVIAARLCAAAINRSFGALADQATPRWRIQLLRWKPLARLTVVVAAVFGLVAIAVVPSWDNLAGLLVGGGLVLAFALKDYGSCLLAGLATLFERVYQPGDWIEVDGVYGEVRSIGLRALRLVTLDDTEVVVPHSVIWHKPVFNATSGQHTILCVADFYLHPEHDGLLVRERLTETASASPFLLPGSPVNVIAAEEPWGTHYRLKAYAKDSREQKLFTTDLTLRAKAVWRDLKIQPALAPALAGPVAAR